MRDEEDVDHIYKLTVRHVDWINPMEDGVFYWEKENECFFDSNEEMEHWHTRLHKASELRCLRITNNFCCISLEVRDPPYFDGSHSIKEFLQAFEAEVPKGRRLWALKLAMCGTPPRWWEMHEEAFQDWEECRDMMILRF